MLVIDHSEVFEVEIAKGVGFGDCTPTNFEGDLGARLRIAVQ